MTVTTQAALTDSQIVDRLADILHSRRITLTSWENGFATAMVHCRRRRCRLSAKQRQAALLMIERHGNPLLLPEPKKQTNDVRQRKR